MNKKKIYGVLTLVLILISIIILSFVDMSNSVQLSLAIQIILILYMSRIVYGCILYIKKQYENRKYSYSIIMNLGLVIFLVLNIARKVILLFVNFNTINIKDIYSNTLDSFNDFAILTVPFIIALSIYGIISNIILIKKEGFSFSNFLGVIFGITNIILVIVGQMIYKLTGKMFLNESQYLIKRFIDLSLNTVLSYWYCLILATIYCNIMAAKHMPEYNKDFIIILGSKIKEDGTLTPLLKARVNKAIDFANNQKKENNKDIIYITSGGRGRDELISESEAMKKYLIENGVKPENIIEESESTNTKENLKLSKEKIDTVNKNGKIIFSTTNYHVFRSGVIANNEGIECEGIGSTTKWYFYSNALVREFVANLFLQRKQHLGLIVLINIILFILVLIGYYLKLI